MRWQRRRTEHPTASSRSRPNRPGRTVPGSWHGREWRGARVSGPFRLTFSSDHGAASEQLLVSILQAPLSIARGLSRSEPHGSCRSAFETHTDDSRRRCLCAQCRDAPFITQPTRASHSAASRTSPRGDRRRSIAALRPRDRPGSGAVRTRAGRLAALRGRRTRQTSPRFRRLARPGRDRAVASPPPLAHAIAWSPATTQTAGRSCRTN